MPRARTQEDVAQIAHRIVAEAVGDIPPEKRRRPKKSLTAEQRRERARHAANMRWHKDATEVPAA